MKNNSGEIITGLLVGLTFGLISLAIVAHNDAARRADASGQPARRFDYISDNPGKSTAIVAVPTLGGAGLGYVLDKARKDSGGGNHTTITVNQVAEGGGQNTANIGTGNESNQSTTSTEIAFEPAQ